MKDNKLIQEKIRVTKEQQEIMKEYQNKNGLLTKAETYRHLINSLKNKE